MLFILTFKLYNEELHGLFSSPSIITIIKSGRMRLAGHVARMRKERNTYKLLAGSSNMYNICITAFPLKKQRGQTV
jgi:hypothetical protein